MSAFNKKRREKKGDIVFTGTLRRVCQEFNFTDNAPYGVLCGSCVKVTLWEVTALQEGNLEG